MSLTHLSGRQQAGILTGALISMLLAALDQTIVGTALPKIIAELHGSALLAWVVSAYLLASAVSVPIMAKLSDIFGRRTLYFVNIGLFLLGSALCGISQNMGQLITFRALQGLGGGFLLASAFTIIGDIFPPRERGKWQGLVGAVFGLSSVIGPTLGGYLTDQFSWRAVFYINVPVGIIAVLVLIATLPNIKRDDHGKIDWWGALALIVMTIPLLIGLLQAKTGGLHSTGSFAWGSLPQLGLFALAALGLAGFIQAERTAADPIVPLRLFRSRNFTLANAITFLTAAALFGGVIYIPIFAQAVAGASATNSGLILIPFTGGVLVSSILTGQLVSRTGRYKLLGMLGLAFITVGMLLLTGISSSTSNATVIRDMIVLGLGMGVTFPLFPLIAQNEFSIRDIGVVTGSVTFFRTVGGAVGSAVLGVIYNTSLADNLAKINAVALPKSVLQLIGNPNVLQSVATVRSIRQGFGALAPALLPAFDRYYADAKAALSTAVAHVFIVGVVVGLTSLIFMIFIHERALQTSNEPVAK